ncbi:PTS sugar transporter subunit IIB [Salibacterium halotolerans]|uniref:PTS system, cellobiose-specific IIB component n=1 Tax=Salibacterium halotolerans TaxID=1884432 RepID=A0A1I5X9P0_9BACI|nr:hypothetical protein [Salibacterium halotolerans]SFQ28688.1 PTS system, cellobiose-specific IIB component [Salibacterium halotolerans]
MKDIIVVCEAGITTSLMVKKLNELVEENQKDFSIRSKSTEESQNYVKGEQVDAVLLGPQVHHKIDEYRNATNAQVLTISVQDYNNMDVYSIFNQLTKALS